MDGLAMSRDLNEASCCAQVRAHLRPGLIRAATTGNFGIRAEMNRRKISAIAAFADGGT